MSLRTLSLNKKVADRLRVFLDQHANCSDIEIRQYGYDIDVICYDCRWKKHGYTKTIKNWDEDNGR